MFLAFLQKNKIRKIEWYELEKMQKEFKKITAKQNYERLEEFCHRSGIKGAVENKYTECKFSMN